MAKRSTKVGSDKTSATHRHKLFLDAYLANGRNATQAAITAGYSEKTARAQGCRLLTQADVVKSLTEATAKIEEISGLSVERTLQEVARLAYFDPRKMFNHDGTMIPIHEMDEDTAAAIASLEHDEIMSGDKKVGLTKKLKLTSKTAALEMAMRHLGQYEKDNRQRGPDLALQVVMMGPP